MWTNQCTDSETRTQETHSIRIYGGCTVYSTVWDFLLPYIIFALSRVRKTSLDHLELTLNRN